LLLTNIIILIIYYQNNVQEHTMLDIYKTSDIEAQTIIIDALANFPCMKSIHCFIQALHDNHILTREKAAQSLKKLFYHQYKIFNDDLVLWTKFWNTYSDLPEFIKLQNKEVE
ncbi:MAG: hypothetical protein K8S87_00455, partial [Planctomycetes bacterium]|nr:hypothetical protein [Planctomycetota bacterium]